MTVVGYVSTQAILCSGMRVPLTFSDRLLVSLQTCSVQMYTRHGRAFRTIGFFARLIRAWEHFILTKVPEDV